MKVHSITLKNFLCYYGSNNIINFEDGLNLILGANGYGKTKLYDAFQWVFKDGITDDSSPGRIKKTGLVKKELISEKALIECEVGETVSCEVIIEVSNNDDIYQLKRKYSVTKIDTENWREDNASTFEVYKKDVIYFKPLDERLAINIPSRLIRDEIMPYVWFQGEKGVNSIIDTTSKDALKRVINKLSDIEKWDEYLAIIQKAANTAGKKFDQELKIKNRNQEEYDRLINEKIFLKRRIDIIGEELTNASKNVEAANDNLNSIFGKLDSAKKINELEEKKKQKINSLKETIDRIDFLQLSLTKRLFTDFWLLMGTEKLIELFEKKYNNYIKFVNERKVVEAIASANQNAQKRLPRGIPERMHLQRMLEEERCLVCNRPAKKGTPEYNAIRELLPEMTKEINPKLDIEPDLRRLYNESFVLVDKIKNAQTEIREAIEERENLIEKRVQLEEEIDRLESDIQNEILNSGVDTASDIISMAEVSNQDLQKYSEIIGRLKVERETRLKELKAVESRLKQLSIGNVDPKTVKKKELLDELVELTERVKDKQYKDLVKQLEIETNLHYENINKPTGAFYGNIKFVETSSGGYLPEILDDNGRRVSNQNTSQTTSLKLSIILAIMSANKSRGYTNRYPLIADAPISYFDPMKKKSFLIETANTFNQSIIIIYDFLTSDSKRSNRFKPNLDELLELKTAIEKNKKKLTVHYLDIPDGISVKNRGELSVNIKPVKLA